MENYIHLSAETPTQFYVEAQNLGTSQHSQDYVTVVTDQQQLDVTCFSLDTNSVAVPLLLELKFLGNKILTNNEFTQIYQLAPQHFKVCVTLPTAVVLKPSVLQKNVNFGTMHLSLFDSTMQYIILQKEDKNYKISLNKHIKNANFQLFGQYYALVGKNNEQDFLMIFDQFGQVIFEETKDMIELKQNTILTLQKMHDIARHGYVCAYTLDDNTLKTKEQYSVYLDEYPHYAQNKHLIALAFLEAVNIGNITLARSYLCDQLNSVLSTQQITGYFGDYLEFEPNFLTNANNSIFFMYENNIAKLYNFEVKNDKIVDITTEVADIQTD